MTKSFGCHEGSTNPMHSQEVWKMEVRERPCPWAPCCLGWQARAWKHLRIFFFLSSICSRKPSVWSQLEEPEQPSRCREEESYSSQGGTKFSLRKQQLRKDLNEMCKSDMHRSWRKHLRQKELQMQSPEVRISVVRAELKMGRVVGAQITEPEGANTFLAL